MRLLVVGLHFPEATIFIVQSEEKKGIVTAQGTQWFTETIDQCRSMTQQFCTYTAHVAFPAHNGLIILTQKSSINACASQAVCVHMVSLVLGNVLCL